MDKNGKKQKRQNKYRETTLYFYVRGNEASMAEWSKAADLRPVIVKMRGFKPHSMQFLEYKTDLLPVLYFFIF